MQVFFMIAIYLGLFLQHLRGGENFILINGFTNEVIKEIGSNINYRVTPASSFKIALSLMGYDAGVLKNEHMPTWNFREGYDDYLESWRTSQTPQTWMKRSCIWFSKIISLRLGKEAIEEYLSSFKYGDQDFSAGIVPPGPFKPAWLNSSLKISPKEQVTFIQKMVQGKLPITNHALQNTKNLLFIEQIIPGWKLFGKTGLGQIYDENGEDLKVRWLVGWIENDQTFFPFAYLLLESKVDVSKTTFRVKQLLEESNLHSTSQLLM